MIRLSASSSTRLNEVVKHVPGAGRALEFLASKQRKAAVCLLLATQRAIISALGGGAVRANMSEVLVGKVARASESRHATGAEKEIPDIREYAKGAPGYFQRWDPHPGTVAGRGRAFLLGKPPDELTYMKRIVAARQHSRDWSIPDLPPVAAGGDDQAEAAPAGATDETAQQITGLRGRLASITETATQTAPPAPAGRIPPAPNGRIPPGVPPQIGQTLLRLLEAPGGTTAAAAGLAIGKSKTVTYGYLSLLRDRDVATTTGEGRAARRIRATPAAPAAAPGGAPPPPAYETIEALAKRVHDGLADVDDDTRAGT